MRTIAIAATAMLLAGCASSSPQQESAAIGPGPQPDAATAERVVRAYLARSLKDPDSLKQFAILSAPRCVKWYRGAFRTGGLEAGWAVNYEFNAKNSYGAYPGVTAAQLVIRGNSPIEMSPVVVREPRLFFGC